MNDAKPSSGHAAGSEAANGDSWTGAIAATSLGASFAQEAWSYWQDACERTILFWDVMRQRGNNYLQHAEETAPHVLKFDWELVADGRKSPRPVNYALVRIKPVEVGESNPSKRPFVIVDPRAGHGPGIGGFKADSEIGVALQAGHPCYFIGFLPEPEPGQTIEDIMDAEARFLERVIELHPDAEGKPAVIGNCQAGWAIMMVAAVRPELFGPVLVAGSPLSYWVGVHGQNPMRYTGGLLGGSWLTALTGDLGNGKFDGAWLVSNFENLNFANTYWSKLYNLYCKVDSEAPRYLGFEQWWGGHVLLNAEEMQFIADQLFIGNKLASGEIVTKEGVRIDLRKIQSPIIVFCSKGDNITPPQQALGWILDLYDSVDDIRAHGQTIVYAVHETIGHLGIFVSGSVAKKEHGEFASNMDLIDVLPPGLYEAVMAPKDPNDPTAEWIAGDYLVRFEQRNLDDIRAFGGNDAEDDRKFAAVARLSEVNLGLYRSFLRPWVGSLATETGAEWLRRLHPLRLQYELFSDRNPLVKAVATMAEGVRAERHPVAADNLLLKAETAASEQIEKALASCGDLRDRASEQIFHAVYGSPLLQALVGLKASDASPRQRLGADVAHAAEVVERIAKSRAQIGDGSAREAAVRALVYIRMAEGAADERGLAVLRRIREEHGGGLTLPEFKELVRDQFFMLLLDEERAVAAIPKMLARSADGAEAAAAAVRRVIGAVGLKSDVGKARFVSVEAMLAAAGKGRGLRVDEPSRGATQPDRPAPRRGRSSKRSAT
jgi:hypothetical protein